MTQSLRILITGFRPFPGAPFNPTQPLVARLTRLRRPAFDNVELIGHIFHVTYNTVDRELPELLTKHRPQALLMFGLADRTPHVRIETSAGRGHGHPRTPPPRCRKLSLQLSELAGDRGRDRRRCSSPRRLRACAAAGARRRIAAQGCGAQG